MNQSTNPGGVPTYQNNGYGGQPQGNGYGGQPQGNGYGVQPQGNGYGVQPQGNGYGGQPQGNGYGGQPQGNVYGGQPQGAGSAYTPEYNTQATEYNPPNQTRGLNANPVGASSFGIGGFNQEQSQGYTNPQNQGYNNPQGVGSSNYGNFPDNQKFTAFDTKRVKQKDMTTGKILGIIPTKVFIVMMLVLVGGALIFGVVRSIAGLGEEPSKVATPIESGVGTGEEGTEVPVDPMDDLFD